MTTQTFTILGAQSNIDWVGRKVTGAHNGTIAIKAGTLVFTNDLLTGGSFTADTRSITVFDVADAATNAQFAGHLASDDFFSSEQYPEATLHIRQAEPRSGGSYHVLGDLTIKGITQPVAFDADVSRAGNRVSATGKITIDRTKYGMKYSSGNFFQNLGDTLIYNNFDLSTRLTAEVATSPSTM